MQSFFEKLKSKRGMIDFATLTGAEWFWGILIVMALIAIIKTYFGINTGDVAQWKTYLERLENWYRSIENVIRIIAWIVSAVLVYGIAFSVTQRNKYFKLEGERVNPPVKESVDSYANAKWERVLKHMESHNESDWKLAILESDIMLDELLDKSGYHGVTMSDKLKQVDKSDFNTIDLAWEAHKIRNMVAHEGSEFAINSREAQRVIKLYEQVFKEFKYI